MITFFKNTMSGIAQVIVQPCSLSGFIILASIAIHSWKMALGAFFGAVIGTATAKFFKFDNFLLVLFSELNIYKLKKHEAYCLVNLVSILLTKFLIKN